MRITLTGTDFNRIMRVCGPAVSKDDVRESLQHIEIQCNGQGEGCATGCDGYTLAQTRFPCQGERGTVMIRPYKTVRNDCAIEITKDGGTVSISDGVETCTRQEPAAPYICHADICKAAQEGEPKITIAFSAQLLKQMLKSYSAGRQIVYLEIREADKAVIVKSSYNACGLVLPMRINGDYKEPEFWRMEEEKQ